VRRHFPCRLGKRKTVSRSLPASRRLSTTRWHCVAQRVSNAWEAASASAAERA
jgi:hypothetical protein